MNELFAAGGTIIAAIITKLKFKKTPRPGKSSLSESIRYFTMENDGFAEQTIKHRFPDIYTKNGLGVYKPSNDILQFKIHDFLKILPENHSHYEVELITEFINKLSAMDFKTIKDFNYKAPFIDVEHLFYFEILINLKSKKDPYKETKCKSYQDPRNSVFIQEILNMVDKAICGSYNSKNKEGLFYSLICHALKGNTVDLSQRLDILKLEDPYIVHDDYKKLKDYMNYNITKVDIIIDNSGVELISDLLLTLALIDLYSVKRVVLHIKVLPVFVSDTIQSEYGNDIEDVINEISKTNNSISDKILNYFKQCKIVIKSDMFWNMPNDFINNKKKFQEIIGKSDLVIVKGDLNFRRLVEDKNWKYNEPYEKFQKKMGYSILSLRAIKSSCIIGLNDDEYRKIDNAEKTTGKYGVIFFNS